MVEVLIAIQARSGSKRLPGKSLEIIEDAIMVEHVLEAARGSAKFINRKSPGININVSVKLLVPTDDPLKDSFGPGVIIEGPENDVLSRYDIAIRACDPDYICRITGDCPLIISPIISKHIIQAVGARLDYCSNTITDLRTFVDGYDVEVVSRRLMNWCIDNAEADLDREHVTTLIKACPPKWAKFGAVFSHLDLSDIKLSVDTKEDLEQVRHRKESLSRKIKLAEEKGYNISRF